MMTPYKNPDDLRTYQRNRIRNQRQDWLALQGCGLCGHRTGLRVYRHMGAPRINWKANGPSHDQFRVVCGDPADCLRRREQGQRPPARPARETTDHKRKRAALRGEPRPKMPTIAEVVVAKARKKQTKIERDLQKEDSRPVCPQHGPKGTMIHEGAVRFVCCGRPAPGFKPAPRPWYER